MATRSLKACAVWWVRRDLRLRDNRALRAALEAGGPLLPLFILDPGILDAPFNRHAEMRKGFLFGGLRALDADLRRRGSRLVVRSGEPRLVLRRILGEAGATLICAEEDCSPQALRRDADIARTLPLRLVPGVTVHRPDEVLKANGTPYTVFTPFSKAWKSLPAPSGSDLIPAPRSLPAPPDVESDDIPALPPPADFPPGEEEARHRLKTFASGPIYQYSSARDMMAMDGTSRLSPYLRFGMISAREAAALAHSLAAGAGPSERHGAEVWLNELIWREFYNAILFHFPRVLEEAFNPALRGIAWRDERAQLAAWQEGRTGFPVVDAAMRQLTKTGWMHNRARMIAASFLVKDLLINWQEGEAWFMRHLVDGDPAANSGGWQWTAGVGTDAAPYFRIFNPVLQSRRFAPDGRYIRQWVPELRGVPDRHIHEPWTMPPGVQRSAGCMIGKDYPAPIVDRGESRERTLAAYRESQARGS